MLSRLPSGEDANTGPRGGELIARARALRPLIEGAAPEIERHREIPDGVLSALHEARLFRLLIPRSQDGEEVEPATLFQVIEAIAMADASVAWCMAQNSGVSMAAAYLKPEVAKTLFGDARASVATGSPDKTAKAVVVEGGYRVSGHWMFASGSRHSQWLGGHARICEPDGSPRLGRDGKPLDQRTMLFPKSSATMIDVWQVMGLKGTGSDSYTVKDLFVPADFSFTRESDADRRESGPVYRISMFSMFGLAFCGVALGIARAMLDDFIALAQKKAPYYSTQLLRDSVSIQAQIGLAQVRLAAARCFVLDNFTRLYEQAARGEPFSAEQRISNRAVTCYAIHQAREVVDSVQHTAGATSVFEKSPYERRFRDMHTVTQQSQGHTTNFETLGQQLLGLNPSAWRA
jgi:alkylation response protein AidB-like acyl-CoA dehydrogenase